jgi:hypothetical protein
MTHETNKTAVKPFRSLPADIQALFGDPPLLSTEDPARYRDMLDRFAECIAPRNIIEWLWVKDVADLSWEILRLRRYRTLMIERRRESDARIEYAPEHADDPEVYDILEQIEAHRNAPTLDTEAESARLLIYYLPKYETIDKLLMAAELRRDRILRELDFRRERIAPLLRKISDEVINASADAVPVAAE